jgi:hypothetical protein
MRRTVLSIFAVLFLLVLTPASAAASYTDPQGRFSVPVPDRDTTPPPALHQVRPQFSSPPYNPATFTVETASAPTGATLDALAQQRLQQSLAKYQGSTLKSSGVLSTTIGGREARWFEVVQIIGSFQWQTRFYTVVNGDTVVYLDFSAMPKNFDAFMNEAVVAIQTFTFAQAVVAPSPSGTPAARPFFIRRLGDG